MQKQDKSPEFSSREYESFLSTAYRSENPLETLQGLCWSEYTFTIKDIYWITENTHICLPTIWDEDSPMIAVRQDLVRLKTWIDSKSQSQPSISSKFFFFAISLIQLWGNIKKRNDGSFYFSMVLNKPLICYVYPNKPSSYIWFHVNENTGELTVQKHNLVSADHGDEKPFRTIVHRTMKPGTVDKMRFTFDLTTRRHMQSARKGQGIMQVAVRLDKRCPHNKRVQVLNGAEKWGNFCIVFSMGKEEELVYIGYNKEYPQEKRAKVYQCIVALHQIKP